MNTHGCRIQKNTTERTTHLSLPAAPPRTLLHPVRRRAPVIGRADLWNVVLSDPGKHSARLLERFHIAVLYVLVATAHLPPHQWGVTRRRQARGGADRRRCLLYLLIPVSLETYGFLSLTISFIPSMIWLGLILLLQCFILNYLISMFTYIYFLYVIFFMVIIYLQINLKLKLLFSQSIYSPVPVSTCDSLQVLLRLLHLLLMGSVLRLSKKLYDRRSAEVICTCIECIYRVYINYQTTFSVSDGGECAYPKI
jgi:hypothetical protein